MPILQDGHRTWGGEQDDEGHRNYKVVFRAKTTSVEGPAAVLQTPGLPAVGAPWFIDADVDPWAYRTPRTSVKPVVEGEPNTNWDIECNFSTKPPQRQQQRCNDTPVEDPLLEPAKVSGSLVKYTEEATTDVFGEPILTSSHEMIRGPQVEFDANRDTIRIEQNVADLQLELLVGMRDTLNDSTMWGLPPRCVKLSNYSWERLYYGQCYVYYKRTLEFETFAKRDPEYVGTGDAPLVSGFDRAILDEGTKVLHGRWATESDSVGTASVAAGAWLITPIWDPYEADFVQPDPSNPAHFIRFTDRQGNPMRVVLDGQGRPFDALAPVKDWYWIDDVDNPYALYATCEKALQVAGSSPVYGPFDYKDEAAATGVAIADCPVISNDRPGSILVQKYPESNFFLLNVPVSL